MKAPASLIRKELPSTIRKAADPRTFEFIISTGTVDRDNDTIAPSGWRLAAFTANPVVLFAHRYDEPPIARAHDVQVGGGALRATVEFPEPGTYDKADVIRRLVEQNFLRATSVGFRPEKWTYNEQRDGIDYFEQTLLEFSIVSVPSNAQALLVGPAKSFNRAKLDAFFGAPRGGGLKCPDSFDLAAIPARDATDEVHGISAADVRDVCRAPALRRWLTEDAARRMKWALTPAGEHVFEPDDAIHVDPSDFAAALAEVIGGEVDQQLAVAIRQARGRVD